MKHRFACLSCIPLVAMLITMLTTMLITMLITWPAQADDIDFSKIQCNAFLTDNKDDAVLLLTWLEGYFAVKSGLPIMYGDQARRDAMNIRNYCFNHGNADLFTAARIEILGK